MPITNRKRLNTTSIFRVTGAVLTAITFSTGFSPVLAQDEIEDGYEMDDLEVAPEPDALGSESTPEVEILSDGNMVITPTMDSHASRIADTELIQSIQQNPEGTVIGKTLQFGSGEVIGTILDVRRKIDDLFLYLVVDATPFFNNDVTYAVAVRDLWEVKDEVVLMPMVRGMHLKGIMYYPEEYVAHDENFSDQRVDEIFTETLSENQSDESDE